MRYQCSICHRNIRIYLGLHSYRHNSKIPSEVGLNIVFRTMIVTLPTALHRPLSLPNILLSKHTVVKQEIKEVFVTRVMKFA